MPDCVWAAVPEEADGHADLHDDQGDGQIRPGQGEGDQESHQQGNTASTDGLKFDIAWSYIEITFTSHYRIRIRMDQH